MRTVIVRYKTSSKENAETNAALVRAVFEELRAKSPEGLRYASYCMEDGVSFVHIASGTNHALLTSLPAFKEFQKAIKERCAEMPVVSELSLVGSYEAS